MIGIVIVSHSSLIADGTKELALQMADPTLKIMAAGGTSDGKLGTDTINFCISSSVHGQSAVQIVLILTDLGSSVLTTEMAIDMMDEDDKDISKIQIANAPLVEGAVIAAVEASFNSDIFSIKKTVEDIIIKKVPL